MLKKEHLENLKFWKIKVPRKAHLQPHVMRENGSPPMDLGLEVVTYWDSLHFPLKWRMCI